MPTAKTDKVIRDILDSNLFGASIAKMDGTLIYANPALLSLFHSSEERFIGRKASEFYLNAKDREFIVTRLKENGFISKIDVDLKRDDSSHFKATLSFMTSSYAGEDAYFCWFYDLTERLQMEEKLANQIKLNLHHSKLASIGELAAGIAHEVNNPLTIISVSNTKLKKEILKGDISSKKILAGLEVIHNAANRIVDIVRGMRNYSRVDSNELEKINLNEVLTETTSLVNDLMKSHGIELSFISDVEESYVSGIRGQLQQVFMNLISNAKDVLVDCDTKQITIKLIKLDGKFVITFTDSGPGVPDNIKFKIFEPFFTTKGFHQGTGIGLSMSHNFITQHNGSMTCSDSEDGGAQFVIELPEIPS